MKNRYRSIVLFSAIIILTSCSASDDTGFERPQTINSAVFDTLQGSWRHFVTRLRIPNTNIIHTILYPSDSIRFRSDLSGTDHFPQVPTSYSPMINFTYRLLPDDSTLIFNTGTSTSPVYDTVIITLITNNTLTYKSRPKLINYTYVSGTFVEESALVR